jgi:hypothetical protein
MRKEPKAELETAQFCTIMMISRQVQVWQVGAGRIMRKEPKPEVNPPKPTRCKQAMRDRRHISLRNRDHFIFANLRDSESNPGVTHPEG